MSGLSFATDLPVITPPSAGSYFNLVSNLVSARNFLGKPVLIVLLVPFFAIVLSASLSTSLSAPSFVYASSIGRTSSSQLLVRYSKLLLPSDHLITA